MLEVYVEGGGLPSLFFFNDTATTEIYTLSLHDALPICLALAAVFLAALLSRFGYFVAESTHTDETVAIDTNIAGNSATAVGTIDPCRRVNVGAVFDVDVVMLNVHDLGGFAFDFRYSGSIVHVTAVNVFMLLANERNSDVIDFTVNLTTPEDSDGTVT